MKTLRLFELCEEKGVIFGKTYSLRSVRRFFRNALYIGGALTWALWHTEFGPHSIWICANPYGVSFTNRAGSKGGSSPTRKSGQGIFGGDQKLGVPRKKTGSLSEQRGAYFRINGTKLFVGLRNTFPHKHTTFLFLRTFAPLGEGQLFPGFAPSSSLRRRYRRIHTLL